MGKVDKVQQPTKDELIIVVHTKKGNQKLYASSNSSSPRVHFIEEQPSNPPTPPPFCMLMRKHLVGARIIDVQQHESDRIIEISFEAMNELGFSLSKKLIIEIMGKHSNIILVDIETGNVIDSIKRVSFDTSRVRQILPGIKYQYPPLQNKIPFERITDEELNSLPKDSSAILKSIGGISPQIAEELSISDNRPALLHALFDEVNPPVPHVYLDESGKPLEFHIADLSQFETSCKRLNFDSISKCVDYYFEHRESTNRMKQLSHGLSRNLEALIEKSRLKLQRLKEDLLAAEDSEKYRLFGELLTANLHNVSPGAKKVSVTSYYDGSKVEIPLDPKYSPSKNAQNYFKKYGKAKTAIKEKQIQIEETEKDLGYLESVQTALDNLTKSEDIELIREELVETGFIRKKGTKEKSRRFKSTPHKYTSPSGYDILVGRNNKENDELTFKLADKQEIWLHVKDIPGSHVILRTGGKDPTAEDIYAAASIAAWHSKAKDSSQVPVDYVKVRHVKKPAGAKPGMVIFTNNRTVYVEPKLPL